MNKSKTEKFAVVNIGDMWSLIYNILTKKYPDKDYGSIYRIQGIYEESNQKFAIICKNDETSNYRLNFSLTEKGIVVEDIMTKVEENFTETKDVKKFAEPTEINISHMKEFSKVENMEDGCPSKEDIEEDKKDDDELDHEELSKLRKDNKAKEDIIMVQTKELEELRKFKEETLSEVKAEKIKCTMAKVKEHLSGEDFTKFEKQGLECKIDELDGWTNSVLASITDKVLKMSNRGDSHFRIPVGAGQQSTSIWDKING